MYTYVINKGDSRATRHSKKAFKNKIKRKNKFFNGNPLLKPIKKGKYFSSHKSVKFSQGIEKFLYTNYQLTNTSNFTGGRDKVVIKLNEDFSLHSNAGKVLLQLVYLLKHAKTLAANPKVVYDGHVSFGALYLLDNLCWEIGKKRKWVIDYGNFPKEEKLKLTNLKSSVSSKFEDDNECMINEKVIIKRGNNEEDSQQYRVKATEITQMVEKAIQSFKNDDTFKLSFAAHTAIKSAIGEQFDNILEHAIESDIGTICCFYDKIKYEITILIYNFGDSLAQTLISKELPPEVWSNISDVLSNHLKKRFFLSSSAFTAENALTLLALQEGISSKLIVDETRGFGLMDFLGHCFELSEDTRVAIVSGQTSIKIDKKYPIRPMLVFGRERRIVAFNEDNDIYQKPDANYVRNIGVNFNGVLIETTIPLKITTHDNDSD